MKYVKGFFVFWYDFIVGDAWEVAVGVALSLLLFYTLTHYVTADNTTGANTPGMGEYGALLFPLIIVALLIFSLWRVRRSG